MVLTRAQRRKRVRREVFDMAVFFDILSRVPVKSLCRFKSVSKSWRSWTSEKYFAKKQMDHSKENPSFVSCPNTIGMKFYTINPGTLESVSLNTNFPVERGDDDCMHMISSFNGLICCIKQIGDKDVDHGFCDLQIWICNPCTGETLLLPQGTPSFEVEPSVGVAYSSDVGDYKVFRIFCSGKRVPEERREPREYYFREGQLFIRYRYALAYECEVYSSSTGSWRKIGPVPRVPMRGTVSLIRSTHIFAGGKIYWLVSLYNGGEILSVDWEGRFEVLKVPSYPSNIHADDQMTEGTYLINLQGSLSLVVRHPSYMDVWVWEKKREKFRWVNVCRPRTQIKESDIVLAMASSKNKIICMTETHWHTFDLKTKTWKRKMGPPSGFLNPSVFPFTESLLTCTGGMAL